MARKRMIDLGLCILVLTLGVWVPSAGLAGQWDVWAVDVHHKVFRDTLPPETSGRIAIRAMRNEYEPGQIAIRSSSPLTGVRVELEPLRQADGRATIGLDRMAWNFVGFIPLTKNTPRSERLQLRPAPCEVPDPLLEERSIDIAADSTQPVWITVHVPRDARPGRYEGRVIVMAGGSRKAVPIELTVDPTVLPGERHVFVTNWFSAANIAKAHGVKLWSEEFWTILERYARNMAAHRQNVVLVPWTLIEVTVEPEGRLSFDYTRFDHFVELFERAGAADRIELGHVGHFGPQGWGGSQIVLRGVTATERGNGQRVTLEPERGLAALLADLQRHLAQRGWLEKAMVHVADEPSIHNAESWREASAAVGRWAPKLRRIEAIEGTDFSGALEVWVPKLSHFDRWRDAYQARRTDGEFWYYICCHPYGNVYPNRFLDYPTACVRVLHWINFAADLKGYLHWGWNHWRDQPFGTPTDRLPPGDTHVVYPGSKGPLNSIRWEIQRESLEDFEYLHLLATRTAAVKKRLGKTADWLDPRRRAMELCRRVVPAIAAIRFDSAAIMATRAAIADEIAALDEPPLLIVQTEPPEGSTLIEGPILVELRGVTEPGAAVKVNGRTVTVRSDGTFSCGTRPTGDGHEIRIEAEHQGREKVAVRRFRVRS